MFRFLTILGGIVLAGAVVRSIIRGNKPSGEVHKPPQRNTNETVPEIDSNRIAEQVSDDRQEVAGLLQSIGKRCFVRCFEYALNNDGAISKADMLACDPLLEGTSDNAISTRRSKIKKIFETGQQLDALQECFNVEDDYETAEKAKRLYETHRHGESRKQTPHPKDAK